MNKTSGAGKLIFATISAVIVVLLLILFITEYQSSLITLRENDIVVEYGDAISLKPEPYLATSTQNPDTVIINSELIEDTTLYTYNPNTCIVTSNGKDSLDMGIYKLTFTRKSSPWLVQVPVNLIVKDTKAPEIVGEPDGAIVVEQYADIDFTKYFHIMDADAKTDVEVDTKRVNLLEQGDYTIRLTATDSSGNETSRTYQVVVVSQEKAEKNPQGMSAYTDGTIPVSQVTQSKIDRHELKGDLFRKTVQEMGE